MESQEYPHTPTNWTEDRHERARAICKAATAGPWVIMDGWVHESDGDARAVRIAGPHGVTVLAAEDSPHTDLRARPADIELIAIASTDLPDALAEIDRLRKIVAVHGENMESQKMQTQKNPPSSTGKHPAVQNVLQFFAYAHLPQPLQAISASIAKLAEQMTRDIPHSTELTVGLRKLLEAKDCFVRAALPPPTIEI